MTRFNDRLEVVRVSELQPLDKIVAGNVLGPLSTVDSVTVKNFAPADQDKVSLTLWGIGTIFVHRDTLVEIVPKADKMHSQPKQ
jgi:hypothetical protein